MELPKTAGKVTTLAFSSDGELLASGWEEGKPNAAIRLFTTVDGKLKGTLPGHKNRISPCCAVGSEQIVYKIAKTRRFLRFW